MRSLYKVLIPTIPAVCDDKFGRQPATTVDSCEWLKEGYTDLDLPVNICYPNPFPICSGKSEILSVVARSPAHTCL